MSASLHSKFASYTQRLGTWSGLGLGLLRRDRHTGLYGDWDLYPWLHGSAGVGKEVSAISNLTAATFLHLGHFLDLVHSYTTHNQYKPCHDGSRGRILDEGLAGNVIATEGYRTWRGWRVTGLGGHGGLPDWMVQPEDGHFSSRRKPLIFNNVICTALVTTCETYRKGKLIYQLHLGEGPRPQISERISKPTSDKCIL